MTRCALATATGSAPLLFEVTQPRVTCYRVGIRMSEPRMAALLTSSGRPGFYLRVLHGRRGRRRRPDREDQRPAPSALTVASTDALLYLAGHDRAKLRVALQIPALSPGWHHRALRNRPAHCARPRRRLRRPHPLELPDRRLPHLHHPPAVGRHHLRPGPAGIPSRRAGAHLLCPAWHRHRCGHVKPGRAMNKQIPPAAPISVGHRMPSAEGAEARPDAFAVSPAIGPLPAIYVPPSPSQATRAQPALARDGPGGRLGRVLPRRLMMWPVMAYLSTGAVRADAVFVSGLRRCDEPSAGQVRQAVAAAIRAFGCSGCAGRVAQEFGDHPETAVIRMRWARAVAREAFADSAPQPGPGADAGGWLVIRPRLPAEQASGSPGAGRREPARSAAGGEG